MNIWARRLVPRVPLLLIHNEGSGHAFHCGVQWVLHDHGRSCELRNVVGEANSSHELGEPRPHLGSVKFTEQRRMMETDPSTSPLLDVFLERCHGFWGPTVRGIVQLDK